MIREADDAWGEVTRTLACQVVRVRLSQAGDRGYIGRFEVRGILGRGGMGIVYDVLDTDSGRQYALKMVAVRFLQLDDSQAAKRFAHEVKVLERLEHPGVVRFVEYGLAETPEGEHLAFFVMERLAGRTIGEALSGGERFDLVEALRIAGAVAESLAYLDARDVQHRDIKPANLYLEQDRRVVLMDFGLARSDHFTKLTRAGHIVGTVFYMSPERLKGHEADIRSDVFALGVVLFEMLTGSRPHAEDDPNALVRAIRRGITWPGGFERTPAHRAVRELVDAMTANEADRRPTPQEIADRCRAIAESVTGVPISFVPEPTVPVPSYSSFIAPPAVMPAVGPTWTTSILITIVFSLLTFIGGLLIGTSRSRAGSTSVAIAPKERQVAPKKQVVVAPRQDIEFSSAEEAFRYGNARLKEGKHVEAIDALEQALNKNPAYADAYRRLGDAHLSTGELEKARSAYEKYKKLRPDAPDAADIERLLQSF